LLTATLLTATTAALTLIILLHFLSSLIRTLLSYSVRIFSGLASRAMRKRKA